MIFLTVDDGSPREYIREFNIFLVDWDIYLFIHWSNYVCFVLFFTTVFTSLQLYLTEMLKMIWSKNHSVLVVETLEHILYHQSSHTSTHYPRDILYLGLSSSIHSVSRLHLNLLVGLFCRATRCSPGCAKPDLPATWSWVWRSPGHDTHYGPYVKAQEDCFRQYCCNDTGLTNVYYY